MKIMKLFLFLLLSLFFSCRQDAVLFPVLEKNRDSAERYFKLLYKSSDPEEFHQLSTALVNDLMLWEQEILRLQSEIQNPPNLVRDLNKSVGKSYQFVVSMHVESYIYRDEMMKPKNYLIQESILKDLDALQVSMNHFMLQTYPIRDIDLAYYKNLPEITSRTADADKNLYYIIDVNIGYKRDEKMTQSALNSSKKSMEDLIRSYCSIHEEQELMGWNEVNLKAGMMKELNDHLAKFYDFKQGKMEGIKNLTFSKIQTFTFN